MTSSRREFVPIVTKVVFDVTPVFEIVTVCTLEPRTATPDGIVNDSAYVPGRINTVFPELAEASAAVIVKNGYAYGFALAIVSLPYTASTISIFPVGVNPYKPPLTVD